MAESVRGNLLDFFFSSGFLTQLHEFHLQLQESIVLQCSYPLFHMHQSQKSKIDSQNYLVS